MPTLLMRLEAPMQSYGVFGKFGERDTAKEPSKSAVIGLICAVLGIERSNDLSWINKFKFGVRVDREGIIKNDYHVAGTQGFYRASGSIERKNAIPTNRLYISDASFLVGFESDDENLLEKIHNALKKPKWQIFLGRKSYVPSTPVWINDGIKSTPLLQTLKDYPFQKKYLREKHLDTVKLRCVIDKESLQGKAIMISKIMDVPINFENRIFVEREVATLFITKKVE